METTLSTLGHLLQPSIKVQRAFPTVPLLVNTVSNELNQVWANLIENAIEAMLGEEKSGSIFTVKTTMSWLRSAITVSIKSDIRALPLSIALRKTDKSTAAAMRG